MNLYRVLPLSAASMLLLGIGCGSSSPSPSSTGPSRATTIFVINYNYTTGTNSILELPANGQGSVTPTGTLLPPKNTILFTAVTVDQSGNIYVGAEDNSTNPSTYDVLVYPPGATGAATPTRTLTGLPAYPGVESLAVDATGQIYMLDESVPYPILDAINVYSPTATGAASPIWQIGGFSSHISYVNPGSINKYVISLDRAGNIYLVDEDSGLPEIVAFSSTASGNPSLTSMGANMYGVNVLYAETIDTAGDSFQVGYPAAQGEYAVIEFAPGAGYYDLPIRTITFNTSNNHAIDGPPAGIAVDAAGNLYISFESQNTPEQPAMYVFPPGASGLSTPAQTITSTAWTGPYYNGQIAVH